MVVGYRVPGTACINIELERRLQRLCFPGRGFEQLGQVDLGIQVSSIGCRFEPGGSGHEIARNMAPVAIPGTEAVLGLGQSGTGSSDEVGRGFAGIFSRLTLF